MNTVVVNKQASYKIKGRTRNRISKTWNEMKANKLAYLFIAPFMICFTIFIVLPVISAFALSFTYFNSLEAPRFVGWDNFKVMITQDLTLMKYVLPNTFKFAVFVGPVGYSLSFFLAWLINQVRGKWKNIFTMAIYTPSIAGAVLVSVVWVVFFSGDRLGYLNNFLISFGFMDTPIDWTQDKRYLMGIMIFVTIWGSMGVGFLSLLAGLQNVNGELYEAGRIDGIRNRLQEIWYITIPAIKPQMLFSSVMAIVGALKAGGIGVQLSGINPTPDYAGQLLQNHIEDYGFTRYELGYSTALSVMLLIIIYLMNRICAKFLGTKEDEG